MVGIYKIENLRNCKVYIGQSLDINKRWYEHKSELHYNKHSNQHLQNAWNKYGEENFKFEVIEECNENELNQKEQYWLDYYGGMDSDNNYNKKEAGSRGKPSEETLLKQSVSHIGNKHSEETRKKMGEAHKGKVFTETERLNISKGLKAYYKNNPQAKNLTRAVGKANKGRRHTEEEKKQISEKLKGRNNTWNKGKKLSKETKRKMSESKKGHFTSEETKNKIAESNKGKIRTKITKNNISESRKEYFKNHPEAKEHLSMIAKQRAVSQETREKLRQKTLAYWKRKRGKKVDEQK